MILAEKITELRKKNGWSQEELAEKLDVSRQAVSKWESAQSVPDMNRVLMLSDLFGVTTDYLLKDDLGEPERTDAPLPEEGGRSLRRVSMQEAQDFLRHRKTAAARVSLGVLMCILSPVALILLAAAQDAGRIPLTEEAAVGLGLLPLFLLVGGAVALFVVTGLAGKRFEYMDKECFETEYGVAGYVREQRDRTQGAFAAQLTVGIVLCVLSAVPIFIAMAFRSSLGEAAGEFVYVPAVAALLCMVGIGVWLIVRASVLRGGYNALLEEGDYTRENKIAQKRNAPISGVYWGIVTAGYLAYSFVTGQWDRSWIVWPVAGVLYGVIIAIVGAVRKKD